MPQELTEEWHADLGLDAEQVHNELLHVLGNLTLTGYNPELGNRPWAQKRERPRDSNVGMNKEIAEELQWGRDEIVARARRLADRALGCGQALLITRNRPAQIPRPRNLRPRLSSQTSIRNASIGFSRLSGVDLSRITDTTFASPDGRVVVVCLVSREYGRRGVLVDVPNTTPEGALNRNHWSVAARLWLARHLAQHPLFRVGTALGAPELHGAR